MYPVAFLALSQISGTTIPSETHKEIHNAILDLMSLVESRGDLGGIVKREIIKTDNGKQWSYHIPPESELTIGLPFSSTIFFSTKQELLEGQEPYEIYISNITNDLRPPKMGQEIAHWLTQIPQLIKKITQEYPKKFSEKLPPSIPEHLKSTGHTDL